MLQVLRRRVDQALIPGVDAINRQCLGLLDAKAQQQRIRLRQRAKVHQPQRLRRGELQQGALAQIAQASALGFTTELRLEQCGVRAVSQIGRDLIGQTKPPGKTSAPWAAQSAVV